MSASGTQAQALSSHHTDSDVLHRDVVIIGAGPAGLSFARAVAASGLRITVVEKSPAAVLADPPYDGREIALTHKSKEIMQALDMWQRVSDHEIYKLKDAKVVNGRSGYQLHFPQPNSARGKPTDTLGYLISNHNIRRVAHAAVQTCPNIELLCGVGVKDVHTDKEAATVNLEDGRRLHAKLLVAADSRFSQTRRQLGIAADMHDFGRTVIVFRMRHSVSNQHSAFECFHYGRTLALLPLEENLTNCVVTIDSHRADSLLKLSPEALAADIEQQLQGRLGSMTLASTLHTYPLVGVHANAFHAQRSALVGDAAVGMHPVTAHGYNLGLAGVERLTAALVSARQRGQDMGSADALAPYAQGHHRHAWPIYQGTNAIVRLYPDARPVPRLLRQLVLQGARRLPPLQAAIVGQLTGQPPQWMRALALRP